MVGSTIPSGKSTMLTLAFSWSGSTELCLSDAIISDANGDGFEYYWPNIWYFDVSNNTVKNQRLLL